MYLDSSSFEDTEAIGRILGEHAWPGMSIKVRGGLGAGKTVLVRGLARGLGIDAPITSPTYTLINVYDSRIPLVHMDWYRLGSPDEALELGLDDYLDGKHVCVLEWPERAPQAMPHDSIDIELTPCGPEARTIVVSLVPNAQTEILAAALTAFKAHKG